MNDFTFNKRKDFCFTKNDPFAIDKSKGAFFRFCKKMAFYTLVLLFALSSKLVRAQDFIHPGGLHTLEDLNRMKAKVAAGESPWIEAWNALTADWKSSATYGMTDGARENANHRQNMNRDAQAAYLNALRWYITGDVAHAEKAISIYNAYANVVNQIPSGGNTDIVGLGGIGFTAMAIGAEIMRLYDGWAPEDFEKFKFMMKEYFYPVTHDFLTNHRGTCSTYYWANWDLNNISAQIAIGILVDDRDIYNEGVEYFKNGIGNGSITNAVPFVQGDFGQWQESGRDQSHSMLGIGLMANICQLAWNQGDDLYGYDDNRFLKGAEFVARTGALSLPAPFFEELNTCGNRRHRWVAINALGRYFDQPVWEIVYNHYVVQQGLEAPHVKAMAQIMRFAGSTNDQLGHGTLTYTLDSSQSPSTFAMPPVELQGVVANAGVGKVELKWDAPITMDATGYNVKRATSPGGPYTTLSSSTSSTYPGYTDSNVTNGTTYYYVVSANNKAGESANSTEVSATPKETVAELPTGWTRQDIGTLSIEGEVSYSDVSGNTFIARGAGIVGGNSDALGFTYGLASGDVSIAARVLEVGGLQKTGIMIRESLDPDAKTVLMKVGDLGWRLAEMGVRTSTGGNMTWIGGNRYTWLPAWFKIERSGNVFTVYESSNGNEWFEVSRSTIEMGTDIYVGLFNSSGNTTSWNSTRFDHVTLVATEGTAPNAPANLVVAPGNTVNTLSWNEVSGASSYSVKRSTVSGGPYTTIASGLNKPEYIDENLSNDTTYYYVTTAENFAGSSANSVEASAIPRLAIPVVPVNLKAKSISATQIDLSWAESLTAATYNVKRATVSGGPYTVIASPASTTYSDTTVTEPNTYYYVISALNAKGESANSEELRGVPGKVTYLNFDETVGTVAMDSWENLDGMLANGASWTTGIVNNGVYLNGNSDGYVTLPEGLITGLKDFTISTWVKLDVNSTWSRIFDFGAGTDNYVFLTPLSGGNTTRYVIYKDGVSKEINSASALSTGEWHHVAITQSGEVAILYIDGEEAGRNNSMTLSPSDLRLTTQNWIGRSQYSADPYLNGTVDDFKVFSKALSSSEISSMYLDVAPPKAPKDVSFNFVDNAVSLSWSASASADSYNVKHATTSGGPYTTIANTTTTAYTDTSCSEGDTCYYVISAINKNGESDNSAEISTVIKKTAYWNFDEISGTTAKDSWGSFDGTLEGGASWTSGALNNGVYLNGSSNGFVTLPEGLVSTLTNFTIATWVKLDERRTWQRIFDFGSGTSTYMFLTPNHNGGGVRFAMRLNNGKEQQINVAYTMPTDIWVHLAVTLNGSTGILYINGQEAGRNTSMTLNPSSLGITTQNWLGKSQWPDAMFKGTIDDFRIYGQGLSAFQVKALAENSDLVPSFDINGEFFANVHDNITYQVPALYFPVSYHAEGLPAGLEIDTLTGIISGSPSETGTFDVTLSAQNDNGVGYANLTMNIFRLTVPGKIEVENYNFGGEGVAYHDIEAVNYGGSYRQEGVDVRYSSKAGSNVIGWNGSGEWQKYAIEVQQSGDYKVIMRATSPSGGGPIHIDIDGQVATDPVYIPRSGSWDSWIDVLFDISLEEGLHEMTMNIDGSGLDFDSFKFYKTQSITFNTLDDKAVGDDDFDPEATVSSGLPITYESSNDDVAIIVNGMIHIVGEGEAVITATQAGDDSYWPAEAVSQTLHVYVRPSVSAKDVTVELDSNGVATITPEQIDNDSVSYNGELILSLDSTTFDCTNVGIPVTVTLTGTDEKGFNSSATAIVTIEDNLEPVVTTQDQFFCYNSTETYNIPEIVASDNCEIEKVAYFISGSTTRYGEGIDASGNFSVGESLVTWVVTDANGNESIVYSTIDINPSLEVNIPDVYVINPTSAINKNTIYKGYDPAEKITVTAEAFGGYGEYSYLWSTGEVSKSIDITSAGTYSVEITDEKGCSASTDIIIEEEDVSCGNNFDKVTVCFRGNTLCIEAIDVSDLLNNGGRLDECGVVEEDQVGYFTLYPNPASDHFVLSTSEELESNASIRVYDNVNQLLLTQKMKESNQTVYIGGLPQGLYIVQLINGNIVTTKKLSKQ